jgi:flagellar basal body P-ring protein FlgI
VIFFLLHDNVPAHSTVSNTKTSRNIEPASIIARFVSPEYVLFPKVKLQLKSARFDTIEEIQKAVTDQLNKIPAEDFSNTMKNLESRANLCITSNGSYFE